MKVKICGITSAADARVAVQAGADALGFIFVEGTPRYIAPAAAAAIVRGLPPFVTPVGVFLDHAAGHVKAVAEECRLGALQFHGDEALEALAGFALPVIKAIKLPPASTLEGMPRDRVQGHVDVLRYRAVVSAVLLDSAARWSEGEAREPVEWRLAATIASACRDRLRPQVILSGGLSDNYESARGVPRCRLVFLFLLRSFLLGCHEVSSVNDFPL